MQELQSRPNPRDAGSGAAVPAKVDTNLNARAYQESSGKQAQKGFFGFGEVGRWGGPGIKLLSQAAKLIGRDVQ